MVHQLGGVFQPTNQPTNRQDVAVARGRNVLIVGAGKTALDCVAEVVAANAAASVTLLYRQVRYGGGGTCVVQRRGTGAA